MAGDEGAKFTFASPIGDLMCTDECWHHALDSVWAVNKNTATWITFAVAVLKRRAKGDENSNACCDRGVSMAVIK